jgi:hypothetical protein
MTVLWLSAGGLCALLTFGTLIGYGVVYTAWLKHATPQKVAHATRATKEIFTTFPRTINMWLDYWILLLKYKKKHYRGVVIPEETNF